jgi:hypothetical protein
VSIPRGPLTTAEKRAARYARKARDQARIQKQKAALATSAEEIAAPAREDAAKQPLPQLQGDGKYEARVVQALVEILTGRPSAARPQKIMMPETIFEKIVLELSSTEQFYYRVTEQGGCTCKGWYYSKRYGVGYCRHYADAFPEQAARNKAIIDQIKADRKARIQARPYAPKPKAQAEDPRDPTPAEMEELKELVTAALKEKHLLFDYVRVESDGLPSLTIRYKFKDDYTEEEEAQIAGMMEAARKMAPKGVEVYASSFL